jgi:hypothetical protein
MSIYVSGTCDGAFLAVERVHLKAPPSGAVRVLRYPEPGRRKPRAGDTLRYNPGKRAAACFPPGVVATDTPPFVIAPECAKRGASPRGKGMRVYLGNEDAELLRALAKAAGCAPREIVARFVSAASAELWAMSRPAETVSVASGGAAGSALCVTPAQLRAAVEARTDVLRELE